MFQTFKRTANITKVYFYQNRYLQLKPSIIANEFYKKNSQKQILEDCLDLTQQQAYRLIKKNKFISEIKNLRLLNTLDILNKLGISKNDICNHPLTLSFQDTTIEHNYFYLKEVGFKNVDASTLLRFRILVKKPISLLKLHGLIPENLNVAENIQTHFNPKEGNVFGKTKFTEEMSVPDIHVALLKEYFIWRIQCTEKEVENLFKTYDKFKYKSVKIICDLINFLTIELKFTPKKLMQHGYLFDIHPIHIKRIMEHFPKLGGEDIKVVFFRYPKLITTPIENFYEISKYLKDYGIHEEAIQKCYEIFSLSPESVLNRLNELKKVPEFDVLSKNPRILLLVYCQNKAKLRLEILRNLNVKNASLHVLCAADNVFEKYTQEGHDRTKGIDLLNFLTTEFDRTFKDIREALSCNPHWYHIPPTVAKDTLEFLIDWGVPKEDIADVPTVLLYSKDQLQTTLMDVQNKIKQNNYLPCDFKQQLNLCLYEIERKYHFSGNGVWGITNKKENIT